VSRISFKIHVQIRFVLLCYCSVPEAWLLECDFSSVRYKTLPLSSLPDSFGKPVKHSARK